MTAITQRYDFTLLFDVTDGNPNGDPDNGNIPRMDYQSGHGLVTDVCLKRKVRNYIGLLKEEQPPYEIYVKDRTVLNQQHERAYEALKLAAKPHKETPGVREWMCQNFYDIRTFGAMMATEVNGGQVRGPVQFSFARSIDPILYAEHSITRLSVTNEKDMEKGQTIGRKYTIPYALYRMNGFISAPFAQRTGFSPMDLALFWEALTNLFEHDRASARGQMTVAGLYIFEHASALGNAQAHELFNLVQVQKKEGLDFARSLNDYEIQIHDSDLPSGIQLNCLVHRASRNVLNPV